MKSQLLKIQQNIPLAPMTTFRIGGPARYFCEAANEDELMEALKYAKENSLAIFVLGGGSNILVSDKGFDGLVIKILDTKYKILDTKIECGAGLPLSQAVKLAAENELTGMEWAAGIPGTVGGAVRGNAGSPRGCMADIIESVRVLEILGSVQVSDLNRNGPKGCVFKNSTVQVWRLEPTQCEFSYRDSIFKKNPNLIILSCVLKLRKGDKGKVESTIKEIIEKRSKSNFPNPKEPSPGSFFKNPIVRDKKLISRFEKDTGVKIKDNENLYQNNSEEIKIPAGWLIEEVGLRGKKVGGAMVSEKHANFVVNMGEATAQDIIILSSIIKQKVRSELGVQLQEEIQYVGF